MSGEGPTTVGSIDAKLELDITHFEEKADIAKAEAKELGALSPEIKVDADVGPALAKMAAAGATVDGLGRKLQGLTAAELAEAQAAGRAANLASQADAARKQELITHGALTNKLIDETIARKNAAAAEKAEADQVLWNTGALKKQLDARNAAILAGEKSAETAAQDAEALDKDTESGGRNIQMNNRRVSGLQVLMGMAPLILAAAAPIGAAAIGLGASFGVMSVAGVLAFKGIKDEMAKGTDVGNQYAAGLGLLKNDLTQLSETSAVAMLGSFNSAVGDLNSRMPFLNQLVGESSSMLGNMGGVALKGVLNGLQAMNPLIQASGVELGQFVGWLAGMTSSNGFTQFVQYAVDNLPGVMHLIEGLVSLAGNILAAFAPLGPGVIAILSGITDGLNSLPLPVLAGLVIAATAVAPAMRLAGFAMAAFGVEANLAVPVVGIFTALLAGMVGAAAAASSSMSGATQSTQDYTQALKDDTNAIGEHVRAQTVQSLSTTSVGSAAQALGISMETLTNASLGNKAAQDQVNTVLDKAKSSYSGVSGAISQYLTGGVGFTAQQQQTKVAVDLVTQGINGNTEAIQRGQAVNAQATAGMASQNDALTVMANRYGMTTAQYEAATTAQQGTAAQLAQTTANMQLQNDAAGILKGTLDLLNGKSISAAQAQNAFDSSLVNMGTHVNAAGKQVKVTTTSIDDMSAASVTLRGQLNSQVTNLQNVIEANGGLANSTGKAREQMVTMRQEIIDNAVAHGIDRDAVTAYIDKLFQIPKSVPPTRIQADTAAALAAVQNYQAAVDALHGNTVWITTHIDSIYSDTHVSNGQGGSGGQTKSSGGLVYRADGGPVLASYLAVGGHPGHPVGTDTVPAWLTPDEYVMKRSSAQSIGTPALDYMNRTGQLPPSGGGRGGGPVTVNLVLDGQIIDTRIVDLSTTAANNAISNANNYAGRRPSR